MSKNIPAPSAAAAVEVARAKPRTRKRAKSGLSAVAAAESAAARVEGLLAKLTSRAASLVEAQRKKPHNWQHFAQIAELEERLRQVLGS